MEKGNSRKSILEQAIKHFGPEHQIQKAIEELSELIQVLSKHTRDPKYKNNTLEEMADVQIMLDQLKIIFGDPKVETQFKLSRLKDMLGTELVDQNNINHPSHYTYGKYEVIEVIEDWDLDYHLGNAVKYIARAGHKDPDKLIEDLRKAIWYIERFISEKEE